MQRRMFRNGFLQVREATQRVVLCGLLSLGLVLAVGSPSRAQDDAEPDAVEGKFEQLPIPATLDERGKEKDERSAVKKRVNDLKMLVNSVINGEQPLPANQAQFDGYFVQLLFPQMTWTQSIESPDRYNSLYKLRQVLISDLRRAAPAVHDHLVAISLDKLKEIVAGNYHPAARINAMLIIAELNQKEFQSRGTPTPPEPYLPALTVMVDALASPDQIDGVRVAAMLGILRHVQWDTRMRETRQQQGGQAQPNKVDDALRDRINQLALEIVSAESPPAGRSADGHAWMRRRAIDILGALGTIGTNVNAATAVDKMVGNDKEPLALRCSAAEALGQMNLPPETRLNPTETASKLGELAVTACRNELKRIDDEKKWLAELQQGAGFAGGMGGAMGGAMGAGGPQGMMGGAGMGGMPGGGGADGPGAAGMAGAMAGGMGGMMGGRGGMAGQGSSRASKADAYRLEIAQRRLKSQLHSVKIGLAGIQNRTTGVLGLAKDGSKEHDAIDKLAKVVASLRDVTDGEEIKDLDKLVGEVRKRLTDLESATKLTVAAARPAAAKGKANAEPDEPDAPAAKPTGKPAANTDTPPAPKPAGEAADAP